MVYDNEMLVPNDAFLRVNVTLVRENCDKVTKEKCDDTTLCIRNKRQTLNEYELSTLGLLAERTIDF